MEAHAPALPAVNTRPDRVQATMLDHPASIVPTAVNGAATPPKDPLSALSTSWFGAVAGPLCPLRPLRPLRRWQIHSGGHDQFWRMAGSTLMVPFDTMRSKSFNFV